MKKFLNKVLLIDGSYMLMRALTAPGLKELTTKSGLPSGGFYGFIKMLIKTLRDSIGYYPIICWDHGHAQRRLDLYPNYKRHADRNAAPPIAGSSDDEFLKALRNQRADLIEFTTKLRIPNVRVEGWEGDDLIYLSTKVANECIVVSDDKDMIQMVCESVKVNRAMEGQLLDVHTMDAFFKYPRYEYFKALIGDPSDNIPHVCDGLGGTSCGKVADWIAEYVAETGCDPHDYSKIFEYLESLKDSPRLKEVRGLSKKWDKLLENRKVFEFNMQLMDFVYVEAPPEFQTMMESCIEPTIYAKPNLLDAYRFLAKYEIQGIDPGVIMTKLTGASGVLIKG